MEVGGGDGLEFEFALGMKVASGRWQNLHFSKERKEQFIKQVCEFQLSALPILHGCAHITCS